MEQKPLIDVSEFRSTDKEFSMSFLKLKAGTALALLTLAATTMVPGLAGAAPVVKLDGGVPSNVIQVDSWRYSDRCGWSGGRWILDLGQGRLVGCRPVRPSGDWRWNRDGNREGWYDNRRRAWHYDKW
jgi:hypothetical protein